MLHPVRPIIDYSPIFLQKCRVSRSTFARTYRREREPRRFHKNSLQIGGRHVDTQTHRENRSVAPMQWCVSACGLRARKKKPAEGVREETEMFVPPEAWKLANFQRAD